MLVLLPGREKSLLRRHVWIFSGAVAALEGEAAPGETVVVTDSKRRFLARAAWSPESQLAARIWSFDPEETIDAAFFRRRIENAVEYRKFLGLDAPEGGCRLVHSEGDALPGLIVDRYGEYLVVQFLSTGVERFRVEIVAALQGQRGSTNAPTSASGRRRDCRREAGCWPARSRRIPSSSPKTVRSSRWMCATGRRAASISTSGIPAGRSANSPQDAGC